MKKDEVKTQMHYAKKGIVTEEMRYVAKDERLEPEFVRTEIAAGRLVIPANINHAHLKPVGIGRSLRCKINANIGNSELRSDKCFEMEKLFAALDAGADAVMDLSTGKDIDAIRRAIIEKCHAPVGTVPFYEAAETVEKIEDLKTDTIFEVIERHAAQGVDFVTVHSGLLSKHVDLALKRTTGIVSRGGALTARWMKMNGKENPLYEHFDRLLQICRRYDLCLSLGDGLRPGSLADASDEAQFAELNVLGELTRRAWKADVQVMVEGPGHIPFNEIEMNVKKQIEVCDGAPFYVLGPIVTDIAAGHDHIASAIGGTMAAYAGAAMLCYVTPKEHLGLPNTDDVRRGVIAHKIAAHAADIALKRTGARDRDDALSRARFGLDWEKQFGLLLDPKTARRYWNEARTQKNGNREPGPETMDELSGSRVSDPGSRACTMCGPKFCAMKITNDLKRDVGN